MQATNVGKTLLLSPIVGFSALPPFAAGHETHSAEAIVRISENQ